MLEILAVWWFARQNGRNAVKKGRKPTIYKVLTVVLWFGFEFFGGIVVGVMTMFSGYSMTGMYTVLLLFAAFGGLISYLIARFAPQGKYVPKDVQMLWDVKERNYELNFPATVDIIRDRAFSGAFVTYNYYLNGKPVGPLKNDTHMVIHTNRVRNLLVAEDAYGNRTKEPFYFEIGDRGHAEIHFKSGKFLPRYSQITPM